MLIWDTASEIYLKKNMMLDDVRAWNSLKLSAWVKLLNFINFQLRNKQGIMESSFKRQILCPARLHGSPSHLLALHGSKCLLQAGPPIHSWCTSEWAASALESSTSNPTVENIPKMIRSMISKSFEIIQTQHNTSPILKRFWKTQPAPTVVFASSNVNKKTCSIKNFWDFLVLGV